jgi:DNA-binding NtrC family response regulator
MVPFDERRSLARRVLVLDDDDDMRESLRALIELLGGDCVTACSVSELIRRRSDVLSCDLAILDINLGHGLPSGIDAYNWLHRERFSGHVTFLTGHARNHPLVAQACQCHDAALLDKPIGILELRQVLAERSN